MTTYKQGDIVLVPVPFTDHTTTKKRPALLISANWYNNNRPDVILVPITSAVRTPLDREEFLIRGTDFQRAGLYKESVIKCGLLFAIYQELIIRRLGTLPIGTITQIHAKVNDVLSGKSQTP